MANRSQWSGDYDYLMGRWSRLIAPQLARHAQVRDGDKVLDIGCGTGSLAASLLDLGPAVRVTGIDGSADFIAIARSALDSDRATLDQGDAQALPYADDGFDRCVSLLVLNFIPDAARAVGEMRRVTRAGGTVAAAVWDYGDGMEMLRHFWDAAASLDGAAAARHERNMPLCRQGELAALWRDCGLADVGETALTIETNFASFADYWEPFLTGIGPSGSYAISLDGQAQAALKQRLLERVAGGDEAAPIALTARAWAVCGRVAD